MVNVITENRLKEQCGDSRSRFGSRSHDEELLLVKTTGAVNQQTNFVFVKPPSLMHGLRCALPPRDKASSWSVRSSD